MACMVAGVSRLKARLKASCWGTRWLSKSVKPRRRSEEHTSELQSLRHLVCRLLLEKKKKKTHTKTPHHASGRQTKDASTLSYREKREPGCLPMSAGICSMLCCAYLCFFFFNDTAPTEIYPLSLHAALPISARAVSEPPTFLIPGKSPASRWNRSEEHTSELQSLRHLVCRLLLEKKKKT